MVLSSASSGHRLVRHSDYGDSTHWLHTVDDRRPNPSKCGTRMLGCLKSMFKQHPWDAENFFLFLTFTVFAKSKVYPFPGSVPTPFIHLISVVALPCPQLGQTHTHCFPSQWSDLLYAPLLWWPSRLFSVASLKSKDDVKTTGMNWMRTYSS